MTDESSSVTGRAIVDSDLHPVVPVPASTNDQAPGANPISVSVIVVTLSRPDYLRNCLAHRASQTVARLQTVVVDTLPAHLTYSLVAEEFPNVRYIRNPARAGTTGLSRNLGRRRFPGMSSRPCTTTPTPAPTGPSSSTTPTPTRMWWVSAVRLSRRSTMRSRWDVTTSGDCVRTAPCRAASPPTLVTISRSTTFLGPTCPSDARQSWRSGESAKATPAPAYEKRPIWPSE